MLTPGASEVAVILGLGRQRQDGEPWVSELELWSRLTGRIERYTDDGGPDAEIGRWVEPGILHRLAHERGWVWGRDIFPGPTLDQPGYIAPGIPWSCRPDALAPVVPATVEAKAPRHLHPDEWGDDPSNIPPYYAVQVLAQVAVGHALHGIEVGILAAMARAPGWGSPRTWVVYELRRSARRERGMVAKVNAWLDRYVAADRPPEPDGSQSASDTLRRLWSPVDDTVHLATPTDLENYHRVLASRDALAELKGRVREARQRLQASMAEATVLEHQGERLATWRTDKNGTRRWRTVADTMTREAA